MPPIVDRYVLGPTETNSYVVRTDREAPTCAVIDPGDAAADVRLELARLGTRPAALLLTHTHFDHIGAVADLAEATRAPVYVPAGEAAVLEHADEIYAAFGVAVRPWRAEQHVHDGDLIHVAGLDWEVIAAPGHSPDHVAYRLGPLLFSGDVLFAGSVGRTDLPGADWDVLLASIRRLLERLPPDTVVYPGHGRETTLADELARNPFLADLRAVAHEGRA